MACSEHVERDDRHVDGSGPRLSFPARRALSRLAERVRGGRDRWVVDVEVELGHSRAAADRDRLDRHRAIAAVKEFQRLDQRRLRLDRDDARAQAAQDGDAVAHVCADVEGEVARRHERAVETVDGRAPLAVAVINPQRTRDAPDGPPGVVPRLVPSRMHGRSMTQTATSRSRVA